MNKTLYSMNPRHKNQNPLNQRDLIHAIDQCPQIIREDKLFLRNKIKEFFKDYQLGEQNIPADVSQLMQIFNECQKPLNKIHLYENHAHWLQVKLRKYITNERRKHKEECLNQFKRQKINEQYKKMNTMRRKFRNQGWDEPYNNPHFGQNNQLRNYSHEMKKLSQYKMTKPQQHKFNHTSRHRHLSGNISPSFEPPKNFQAQSCKNSSGHTFNYERVGFRTNRSTSKDKSRRQKFITQALKNNTIPNKTKKTIESSQKKRNKENESNNLSKSIHAHNSCQTQYQYNDTHNQDTFNKPQVNYNKQTSISRNENSNEAKKSTYNQVDDISLDHWSPYKYESKKDNFMNSEGFSTIKQVNPNNNFESVDPSTYSQFHQSTNQQSLYTSPELLEECRRFIKYSEINPNKRNFQSFRNEENRTFQNEQKMFQKIQYDSPKIWKEESLNRFQTMKEFLKHIFSKGWRVYISPSQKFTLLNKSPLGYEKDVQYFLNKIDPITNFLNFLQIFSDIKKCPGITFAFSNVFQLLDVESKGYINPIDYQIFIQNFTDCPIDPNTLNQLKQKIEKFKKVVQQKFRGTQIIPGCFQYLQLIDNPQIFQLCQILQLFQFEIDSNNNDI